MFETHPPPSGAPVACTPAAIPTGERDHWLEIGKKVYAAVQEVQELADGYACRLPGDIQTLRDVVEHISRDRLCCGFLRWTLRVEPEQGDVWLSMTGTAAAKQLLFESFETTQLLPLAVAQQSGFDLARRPAIDGESVEQVAARVNQTIAEAGQER